MENKGCAFCGRVIKGLDEKGVCWRCRREDEIGEALERGEIGEETAERKLMQVRLDKSYREAGGPPVVCPTCGYDIWSIELEVGAKQLYKIADDGTLIPSGFVRESRVARQGWHTIVCSRCHGLVTVLVTDHTIEGHLFGDMGGPTK